MAQLEPHANVVELLGIVPGPFALVLGMSELGALDTVLKGRANDGDAPPFTYEQRCGLLAQTACGLDHLLSAGIGHNDLAARNIMVDGAYKCKIADFGLGGIMRPLDGDGARRPCHVASNRQIAVRWCSPEGMGEHTFYPKSDVYSLAMVVIEVLTDGLAPFFYIRTNAEVREAVLNEGAQHIQPATCPVRFSFHAPMRPSMIPAPKSAGELSPTLSGIFHHLPSGPNSQNTVNQANIRCRATAVKVVENSPKSTKLANLAENPYNCTNPPNSGPPQPLLAHKRTTRVFVRRNSLRTNKVLPFPIWRNTGRLLTCGDVLGHVFDALS